MKRPMKRSTKAALAALLLAVPLVALVAAESGAGIWLATIGKPRQTRVARFAPQKPSGLSSECDPVVTSPKLRGGELQLGAGDSLTVALAGKATRCPGRTASFFTRVDDGEEQAAGTALVAADGTWSKSLAVADGARTAFSVQLTSSAGRTTRTTVYLEADTSKAVVQVDSPATDDWGFARLVAPALELGCGGGGNRHVDLGEPGWIADADCAAGGQLDPDVTVRGATGGTLVVTYDGQELASVPITSSPQRFTAVELGRLTLPNATRADLVFRADAGAATAEATVGMRVMVTTPPPATGLEARMIHPWHADFDLSYVLPEIPADAPSAGTEVGWSNSTLRSGPGGSASVSIGTTPVLIPATDLTRTFVMLVNPNTTYPIFCALDDPAVTPATATHVAGVKTTNNGGTMATVVDAPCERNLPCDVGARRELYCVREAAAAAFTYRWDSWLAFDFNAPAITKKRHHCLMLDPSATPQVWECGGREYAPGDRVVMEFRSMPPLNTYYFGVLVTL